ncbi:MAG: MlaD family protein [Candidatus Zixiibacteriota bacterium]
MEEKVKRINLRETKKVAIGTVIIFAILVVLVTIYLVGRDQGVLSRRYELRTRMNSTGGLEEGAPIHLAGVRVGSVSDVFFVTTEAGLTRVEVVMSLSPKYRNRIKSDARAYIGTLGLLGDKYLGLTTGQPNSQPAKPGTYLQSDAPVDFERVIQNSIGVIDDFKEGAKSLRNIATKIDSGKGTLGMLVNNSDMYVDMNGLVKMLHGVGRKVENNKGTIGRLFNDPELYTSLDNALKDISATLDTFQQSQGTLKLLMTDREAYDNMIATLARADSLLYQIEKGDGTAGQFISNRELYDKLNGTVDDMNIFLEDFMDNPRKYIDLKVSIF